MAKKIPCQFCRQRRRKCEKIYPNDSCQRCLALNRECTTQYVYVQDEISAEDEQTADIFAEIKDLENQLESLELTLYQKKALVKREPSWDLQYVNGELRLATEIKTLEELMVYGKAAIRYLSPFGSTFKAKSIALDGLSFVRHAMKIISLHQNEDESSPKSISKRFSISEAVFWEPRPIVQRLVDNFFYCFNDIVPILHQPSFMDHYNRLQDPMQDPVVLAICTSSAISTCKHNFFNSHEKRYFSEYFYDLCMEKLVDMFDDPDKALESVIIINLLSTFMVTTSRVADTFKWCSLSMVLCDNLHKEFPDYAHGGPHLPKMTRIKYSIIHRNSVMPFRDFITYDIRVLIKQNNKPFDILPDEIGKTRNIFTVFNHILGLSTNPGFVAVVEQVKQLAAGNSVKVSLQEIVRYEEAVAQWWHSLPAELKICADPFMLTPEMIEKESNPGKLVLASYVHINTLNIQGCLIQPKAQHNSQDDLSHMVSNKAIRLVMQSTDVCFSLINQLEQIESFCYSSTKILVRCIDALMILLQVQDQDIVKTATSKLNRFMHALTERVSPDHRVSSSASPYSMLTIAPPGPTPSIAELYKNYPLPREALIFDIVRTVVEQNTDNLAALNPLL